jgi:hypothetical protein
VNFNYGIVDTHLNVAWSLDESDSTTAQPSMAYDDFGSKWTLSDGVATISIPENREQPVIVVKTEGTTAVTAGGEALTIAEGSTGTTSGGTEISVDEVIVGVSECVGEEGAAVTCTASPSSYAAKAAVQNPIVYLDVEAPVGKNVIVGGPVVNTLAAQVVGLSDRLTAPGDYVAEIDAATGGIIVAGYHKEDTARAAQELIDAIDTLA